MALEVFKCGNCGARVAPPPSSMKMVVCEFCGNPALNPFFIEPPPAAAHAAHVAHAAPAAPVAHAAPAAPVAHTAPAAHAAHAAPVARSAEEVARLAQVHLKVFDSLFYAPAIPPKKEQGARGSYGAMIPADDPILALYDSTVFGGADDGFVITPKRLGWKNIGLDPKVILWTAFDVGSVGTTNEAVKVMGDEIQLEASSELQGRMVQFLRAMGAPAPAHAPAPAAAPVHASAPSAQARVVATPAARPAPVAAAQSAAPAAPAIKVQRPDAIKVTPAVKVQRPEAGKVTPSLKVKRPAAEEESEDEGYDEETVQGWIDDTRGYAEEHLTASASLYIAPNIPREKIRLAFQTHADEIEEDDTVVVLYDPAGGGADDGFIATPWGLFWKNRGEDPHVVWWEDLDIDDVELDDGALTIEGEAVRINRQDDGLADELAAFIEAMVDWAQSEE